MTKAQKDARSKRMKAFNKKVAALIKQGLSLKEARKQAAASVLKKAVKAGRPKKAVKKVGRPRKAAVKKVGRPKKKAAKKPVKKVGRPKKKAAKKVGRPRKAAVKKTGRPRGRPRRRKPAPRKAMKVFSFKRF